MPQLPIRFPPHLARLCHSSAPGSPILLRHPAARERLVCLPRPFSTAGGRTGERGSGTWLANSLSCLAHRPEGKAEHQDLQ